ncbi:MAG: hypothetical protein EBQ96_04475 [Proteobacteria bacterium]|nr:hypothetical protein [Pseudomonadota bacterium]
MTDAISKGFMNPADDLGLLTLIDAQAVRDLAAAINNLDSEALAGRKLVIMLATGGTLAMKTEGGIRVPHLDFQALLDASDPRLNSMFKVVGLQAFNVDSSQMDYRHVRDIAIALTWLWNNIKCPFTGFLVTHGTDTMTYSAATLSLMMGQGMPFSVVYTGSQRPIHEPMSDAPINIRNALHTLDSLHSRDMAEVVIVMGDRALLGTSAEKVDDMLANAFDAPRHRYVANFSRLEYPVHLAEWLNPRRRIPFEPTIWRGDFSHTLVVKSTLGLNPAMVAQQVTMDEVRAVILYSYGAGTIYEDIINATIPPAHARNIPVFVVNPVHSDYRVEYLSSFKAIQMGAVPLDMTLSAALAKIEIALRMHMGDLKAMSRFMTSNYVGEIPSHISRFVPNK